MANWFKWPSFLRRQRTANHADVEECCSDYVDGDVPEPMHSRLEDHLSWCGPCAAFISSLRSTVDSLRGLPEQKAPVEFKEALRRTSRENQD